MTERALYISNSGAVSCADHGGGYLASTAKTKPQARTLSTPLDVWTRLNRAETTELEKLGLDCASCQPLTSIDEPTEEAG